MGAAQLAIRLGIAVAISLLGIASFWGWNRWQLRRLGRAGGGALRGLETMRAGGPGILYFTTPDCQVGITTQKPTLKRLEGEMGAGVQGIGMTATGRRELADFWARLCR